LRGSGLGGGMQVVGEGPRWMLRLETGEEVLGALGRWAGEAGVRAAAVPMGIGQLTQATLGFWNGQEYQKREITTPVELIALQGSIAEADGEPSVHLHAAVGDHEHATISGHVLRATIGLLGELFVVSFPEHRFDRPLDESVGLRRLRLDPPDRRPR
jgi:uncharacterized protein